MSVTNVQVLTKKARKMRCLVDFDDGSVAMVWFQNGRVVRGMVHDRQNLRYWELTTAESANVNNALKKVKISS